MKMYLSKIYLRHWRVYSEATFHFERPTQNRPITLIGAMNGHGKTSLLMALYLGLFGKHGLQHCEGFQNQTSHDKKESLRSMKKAMDQNFRRAGSPYEEPTEIELVFSDSRPGFTEEIRIRRCWFFDSNNNLRRGDNSETLEVQQINDQHPDGQLLDYESLDDAHDKLERMLFPEHLTPAFFFDGEQAAALIERMGKGGLARASQVMYGTDLIEKAAECLRKFSSTTAGKVGGKTKQGKLEGERNTIDSTINQLNRELVQLKQKRADLNVETTAQENKRDKIKRKINLLGGPGSGDVTQLQKAVERAQKEESESRNRLCNGFSDAGLALAIYRFKEPILEQLKKEHLREEYESLKEATVSRRESVISKAFPEPADKDPLLRHMALETREHLKQRFYESLVAIYDPPPKDMAERYLLGHAKGEARERLKADVEKAAAEHANNLRQRAKRYRDAVDALDDANDRLHNEENRPEELRLLTKELDQLNEDIRNAHVRLGELNNQIGAKQSELENKDKRRGEILSQMQELEPALKRMAIADRARRVLDNFSKQLKQIIAESLEEVVNEHFQKIAAEKFQKGKVQIFDDKPPLWKGPNGEELHLGAASGFERRSFSIAFCLALVEITKRSIPLVIDTPIGNADTEYRHRALKALAEFKLTDQIIILTHDAEVNQDFLKAIEDHVNQKMLVEFDSQTGDSKIHNHKFFDFSR